ncbi:hypothetical protein CIB48_g1903 [Xylaria polymorpha]|nr:hypothetical protein CIB48_g1903 [Xylaria polymorpha]
MAEAQPSNKLTIRLPLPGSRGQNFEDIVLKCAEFIQCSKTCVGDDNDASAPSSPCETFPELRPVFLPNEIVLHIIEYLNEPYKLRGNITPDQRSWLPIIVFFKPRLWASMPAFQICRATRSQAIKRYGRPLPNALPFDASVDSISLQTEEFFRYFDQNSISTRTSRTHSLLDTIGEDSFFYCNADEKSANTMKPVNRLDYNLLDKIQCVEIELVDRGFYFEQWAQIWIYLSGLKSLHKLKLKLYQYDTCGSSMDEKRAASISGRHPYKRTDIESIVGLASGLYMHKSLAVFEIEKSKARCSAQINYDLRYFDKDELTAWASDWIT